MNKIDKLMRQGVDQNVFPGGVLMVSKNDRILFFEAYGYANLFTKQPMTKKTVFDLASLTKPLATTLAVLVLIRQGRLSLDQTLASILTPCMDSEKGMITVKHLLSHHSGFPDYRPYYLTLSKSPFENRKDLLSRLLLKEPLINPIGKEALYSDPGFMILRQIIETVSEQTLDQFVTENIYMPLGLEDLFFPGLKPEKRRRCFAATEDCSWRNFLLEGVVHDENAYAMGGIDGHSGLFGNAEGIHKLLREMVSVYHGKELSLIFQKELLRVFFKRHKNSDRALGFDTPAKTNSSCGQYFPRESIGHLGFTGTSFWVDLENKVVVILLTNRIHPTRDNTAIKEFRPKIHDAIMENIHQHTRTD